MQRLPVVAAIQRLGFGQSQVDDRIDEGRRKVAAVMAVGVKKVGRVRRWVSGSAFRQSRRLAVCKGLGAVQ